MPENAPHYKRENMKQFVENNNNLSPQKSGSRYEMSHEKKEAYILCSY